MHVRETLRTRHEFTAMGTSVLLVLDAPDDDRSRQALLDAERELHRLEQILSRFDPTSELCRLETCRALVASEELFEVVAAALDARARSGGRFDPTILPSLRALGYDRTFAKVDAKSAGSSIKPHSPGQVMLHPATRVILLDAGTALDLGGIAKGWIADRIAAQLARTAPALVDAGGDIACTPRHDDLPWSIAIDGASDNTRLQLLAGGVATSGTDRRHWHGPDGARCPVRHHVVDPRTGASSSTDLIRVTVVAASCASAEPAATSLLVGGSAALDETAATFDVAWIATPTDPRLPALRSKELR